MNREELIAARDSDKVERHRYSFIGPWVTIFGRTAMMVFWTSNAFMVYVTWIVHPRLIDSFTFLLHGLVLPVAVRCSPRFAYRLAALAYALVVMWYAVRENHGVTDGLERVIVPGAAVTVFVLAVAATSAQRVCTTWWKIGKGP